MHVSDFFCNLDQSERITTNALILNSERLKISDSQFAKVSILPTSLKLITTVAVTYSLYSVCKGINGVSVGLGSQGVWRIDDAFQTKAWKTGVNANCLPTVGKIWFYFTIHGKFIDWLVMEA